MRLQINTVAMRLQIKTVCNAAPTYQSTAAVVACMRCIILNYRRCAC